MASSLNIQIQNEDESIELIIQNKLQRILTNGDNKEI